MLQQTTVAAVVPYYERFLHAFPDVHALAAAEEVEVLKLWEGLGYYSRARNLHRGAQEIVARHGGVFPRHPDQLQQLPGIGRYTAGAIASFAFQQRAPIVEANTLRRYCRLLGYAGDPRGAAGQQLLWKFAEAVLPADQPGEFNQALMDLGATVCTPSQPDCAACPVQRWCRAFRENRTAEIPPAARKPSITELAAYAVAIKRQAKYLFRRCAPGERWAGLWDFPRYEFEPPFPASRDIERLIVDAVKKQTGLKVQLGPPVAEFRHSVTRYRITLRCFTAEPLEGRLPKTGEWAWVSPSDFADLPLSVTGRKLAQRLQDSLF
jgi:A/G-specific adenine glycosylase